MRGKVFCTILVLVVVLTSLLAACAPALTPTPLPSPTEPAVVTALPRPTSTASAPPVPVAATDEQPRLAVVSAFGAELEKLIEATDVTQKQVIVGTTYYLGRLGGNDVVLFLSGVSMVNAAMKTQTAIDHFNIQGIVFSGIAGGVNPHLGIGDVAVPAQWGQYLESYFARETSPGVFTPPSWYKPEWPNFGMIYPSSVGAVREGGKPDFYEEVFWFPADGTMLEAASRAAAAVSLSQCTPESVCLSHKPVVQVGGSGVSGQAFVDNAEFREWVWQNFKADALDMETAAVAHVAYTNRKPYVAFRSLSDLAGGGPGENEIGTFFRLAADNSAELVIEFLEVWGASSKVPPPVVETPKPKVAFVYVGPTGDMGWTYAHDQGRLYLERELGVETAYSELTAEGPDATRIIRDYAEKGYKVVFATSFGYMDSVIEVAKDYPDTVFEHATGYKIADNVGIYDGRGYQGWYLAGIVAGKMTKKNILGYIAPYPIPEVVRNMNAFTLGARAVNPKVEVHPLWIFTWVDPPKEREAAEALYDLGADVIARESDSTEPDKLAQERGIYVVGYNAYVPDAAPDALLTAPIWNWGVFYKKAVRDVMNGIWTNTPVWWGLKEGLLELAPYGKMVPDDVKALVEARKKEIIADKFDVFVGPIKDNQGVLRVPEGKVMTDEEKLAFDWLVEGIVKTATIPK